MKTHFKLFIIIFSLLSMHAFAQDKSALTGAWHSENQGQEDILLFQDGYVTHTVFNADEFLMSHGGTYKIVGSQIAVIVEYNSADENEVGAQFTLNFEMINSQLVLTVNSERMTWNRLDNSVAPLAGVWQITDRIQDGGLVPIQRSGTRKTLKILTGSRFHWFAIDPATKLFAGTGGGTYTFTNGKYTENIDFFSRDNTRVGAKLAFDGKLEDGRWHHSGLSSKGDKIYEVWGRTPY